jgi:hypothetical protein
MRGRRPSGGPSALVRLLAGVQLDTISVLARSHELVTFSRIGPVPRAKIDQAFWGPANDTFEYWSHAACELEDRELSCGYVRDCLRDQGPLTARELGGAKKGSTWWDWSETKIAAEWMLDTGEVVCRSRRGFERVYDLAERAIPPSLSSLELDDEACARELVESAGRAMGIARWRTLGRTTASELVRFAA